MLTQENVRKLIRDSATTPGQKWHGDGRSLFLVTRGGKGSWVLHFRDPREGGAVRNAGIGSAEVLPAAAARKKRDSFMAALSEGREVGLLTREKRNEIFGTAADAWLSNHAEEWNESTRADNKALYALHVPDAFKAMPLALITPEHVADVLRPIWNGPGSNRGTRVRRIIFGTLASKGVHPNPARWEDGPLSNLLSRKAAAVVHHEAMAWRDVPAFLKTKGDSLEDRAGRFIILTAVRRKEGLAATWGEFDLKAKVWTIPAERTKRRKPHTVPLSDAAIACMGKPGRADALVFTRTGGMVGSKTLDQNWLPKAPSGAPYTLHGFRATFGTWAEENGYAPALIDRALGHSKEDRDTQASVRESYQRSQLTEQRRDLMAKWAKFVTGR